MPFRIVYDPLVEADLSLIREFLARFPDAFPSRTIQEIFAEIEKLTDWPNRHRRLDEFPALRKLTVGKYNVLYQVDEAQELVQIEYIFHQSRDLKRALIREAPTLEER